LARLDAHGHGVNAGEIDWAWKNVYELAGGIRAEYSRRAWRAGGGY